ncbi:MAG: lamin tail domain-containing protein [Bacteroidales bacterium]|nr:lamin tail domain-containing protein [Bacteroidales bacterium]
MVLFLGNHLIAQYCPPFVENISVLVNSIDLTFSKPIDFEKLSSNNFIGSNIEVLSIYKIDNYSVRLICDSISCNFKSITVKNLTDIDGLILSDTTLTISPELDVKYGDIIINELMIDPSPSVGIPEVEYIEFYNTTDCDISLKNFKLFVNNSFIIIPESTIQPRLYLIVASQKMLLDSSREILIENLPTLPNTGAYILLKSNFEDLISFCQYSYDWMGNKNKADGGWSYERCSKENDANWQLSENLAGGTPAKENSIAECAADKVAPVILNISLKNENIINIVFNEPVIPLSCIFHDNNIVVDSVYLANSEQTLLAIQLSDSIKDTDIYKLTLSLADYWGNQTTVTTKVANWQPTISGDLIINEVLFNPYVTGEDFVELLNISNKTLNLRQLQIANCRNDANSFSQSYLISENDILLFPGEYFVLSKDVSSLCALYTCAEDSKMKKMQSMPSFPNESGCVYVSDVNNTIVDSLFYDETMHHPLIYDKEGVSLERISSKKHIYDKKNWHSASQISGFATPGYENSQSDDNKDTEAILTCEKNFFTPNNDGIDDYLSINYSLDFQGYLATISVYNEIGILVRNLENNLLLDLSGSIYWDGTDNVGKIVNYGIYVIHISIYNTEGEVIRKKMACTKQ